MKKETITQVLAMVVLWSKRSKKNLIKNLEKSTLSSNPIKNLKKVLIKEPYQESKQKYLIKNLKKYLIKEPYQGSKKGTLSEI